MDSCKCPITNEVFEDPVIGDDGHTYEGKAITEWLTKNGTKRPLNQAPDDVVYIPCEYCKALIHLSNWSIHTDTCRENEEIRLANLAQIISQEPITAKFPCEYYQQLRSADELETHEVSATMR
ncbi:unnamed protein product [Rotaria sordida]|uniref:U-box domain-containing protein n=1 Tax=Rotaria sordida TaxID=392033 RepID=A0A815AZ44_9BILA|nr:unnamed protein product [Rotaria sordida]